ncbi:MAG: helix-turn-helix domain-containing protein [Candidatus Magasanikbacteria bacterium]
MKTLRKNLQKLGFSKNKIDVYLALYEEGEAKARKIIDKTDLHRNIVYTELNELIDKNLVAKKEESGVAVFQVLAPQRLMQEIKRKEEIAKNTIEELQTINEPQKQEIVIREGKEELRDILYEMHENRDENEEWKILGASEKWFEKNILSQDDYNELIKKQEKKGFRKKIISSSSIKDFPERSNTEFKLVPSLTTEDNEVHVFGDKVIHTVLVEPYTVIEFSNKKLVNSYDSFFNSLWSQEVITYRGWDEIKNMYMDVVLPSLESGDDSYLFTTYPQQEKEAEIGSRVWDEFNEKWKEKGLNKKFIFFSEEEAEITKERHRETGIRKKCEYKTLPKEYFSVLSIVIYGDKYVALTDLSEPVATLYSNENIIESYKSHFKMLWNIAEK